MQTVLKPIEKWLALPCLLPEVITVAGQARVLPGYRVEDGWGCRGNFQDAWGERVKVPQVDQWLGTRLCPDLLPDLQSTPTGISVSFTLQDARHDFVELCGMLYVPPWLTRGFFICMVVPHPSPASSWSETHSSSGPVLELPCSGWL